jgi:hypothetical protein
MFFSEVFNRPIQRLDGFIDRLLRLDCTQKILLALQDKDSLLQYLANVPVGLIPEVLAFPLRRVANEHQYKHLSITRIIAVSSLMQRGKESTYQQIDLLEIITFIPQFTKRLEKWILIFTLIVTSLVWDLSALQRLSGLILMLMLSTRHFVGLL